MGMGLKIELIEAEPVGLKWYERYWSYITVIGMGLGITAIALAKKKKK